MFTVGIFSPMIELTGLPGFTVIKRLKSDRLSWEIPSATNLTLTLCDGPPVSGLLACHVPTTPPLRKANS